MMERFVRNVRRDYPTAEQMYEVGIEFKVAERDSKPTFEQMRRLAGYKITSQDAADVVMLRPDRIATVRMAPYRGWEELQKRAKENYELLKKYVAIVS
jgi:uncharacterized protein (TIGR04255 family)